MPKTAQINADASVETAWLFAPSFVQVRVRGRAYTYPPPQGSRSGAQLPAHSSSSTGADAQVREEEWKKEWQHMFHTATSPYLRATFARPAVPGSKLSAAPDSSTWPTVLRDDEVSRLVLAGQERVGAGPQRWGNKEMRRKNKSLPAPGYPSFSAHSRLPPQNRKPRP